MRSFPQFPCHFCPFYNASVLTERLRFAILRTVQMSGNHRHQRPLTSLEKQDSWLSGLLYHVIFFSDLYNKAIFDIFKFVRTEAKFKIPKKMSVLQSIVNYILEDKKADYSSFIAKLENEGVGGSKSILLDYGVPSTAIKKIRTNLDSTEIIDYIKNNLDSLNFTNYEREIVEKL